MPFFAYSGRDASGALVKGVLESADMGAAASQLFSTGITPVDIQPAVAPEKPDEDGIDWFGEKVTHFDVMMFSRQMHTLLKAGIPIMTPWAAQIFPPKAKLSRYRAAVAGLDSGRELSAAMQQHPKFNSFKWHGAGGQSTGVLERHSCG